MIKAYLVITLFCLWFFEEPNKNAASWSLWGIFDRGSKGSKGSQKTKDFSNMPLEEKRSYYRCEYFVTVDKVQTWPEYAKDIHYYFTEKGIILLYSFIIIILNLFPY